MKIGLIDIDSLLPNLAIMKISSYYKAAGCQVEFLHEGQRYDKIYASAIFTKSQDKCRRLLEQYGSIIEIGGTGWDIEKKLPEEIEQCRPDYLLYTAERVALNIKGIMTRERKFQKAWQIVDAGMGFTSRGCIRKCAFCFVPCKEGPLKQNTEIKDIVNPRSNIIILHDNNFTADPYYFEKLKEVRERQLIVDLNQGIDIRLMTEEKAKALSEVRHLRSIHYAWDLMESEAAVLKGIRRLLMFIRPYRHMCFMLTGFNTSFEEDMYRFRMLKEMGIDPYVMRYNDRRDDVRLNHFTRWVNARVYNQCDFEEYLPWVKARIS